jgi:regulator of replication initiation timing
MNEQMVNLENQLNLLTTKFNELENRATSDVQEITQELNYIKFELDKLKNEFSEVKNSSEKNQGNQKLLQEDADKLVELITQYFDAFSSNNFSDFEASGYNIDDYSLELDYDNEIRLDSVSIKFGDYWLENYLFDSATMYNFCELNFAEDSIEWKLFKMIDENLFEKLEEYFANAVGNCFDSRTYDFQDVDDFQVELYDKSVELTSCCVSADLIVDFWKEKIDYSVEDLSEIIYSYFQVQTQED